MKNPVQQMPFLVSGHGEVSLSREGTVVLVLLCLVWLKVKAMGGVLQPCQVFTEGHISDLEFLGRRGAGKRCCFWGLRDRWEQGAEWEGNWQMGTGRTGYPTMDLDWWPFMPRGHTPLDKQFKYNFNACHTAH